MRVWVPLISFQRDLKPEYSIVDLKEFSSIFKKVQHSHSRHQNFSHPSHPDACRPVGLSVDHNHHKNTTSNLLRIHLKGKLMVGNGSLLEGATCMYINLW